MHFPRHWAAARRGQVSAWGWSDAGLAQAQEQAATRLDGILQWLREGRGRPLQRYGYPGRPMREPVLREFRASDGTLAAAVTRNSYGCLVLNTVQLLFVDIDAPEIKEPSFFAGLFSRRKPDRNEQAAEFEATVMENVRVWLAGRPNWAWRVYRTNAGIRLMASHAAIGPEDPVCRDAFEHFSADPLYRRLCATQKCFRARLTPKPWRCGMDKPRHRWPWEDATAEAAFGAWEKKYLEAAAAFATCRLVAQQGAEIVHPALQELVEFHDRATRAGARDLPLA